MPSLLSRLGSGIGNLLGWGDDAARPPDRGVVTPALIEGVLGPPSRPPNIARDQIVSDVIMVPYRGPFDFGNYGRETWEMRQKYRYNYRAHPVVRAAMLGKIAAVSCLDPNVLPESDEPYKGDSRRQELAQEIAEFVNYTISNSAQGWLELIESVYSAAVVDGFSVNAKKLRPDVYWRGRRLWGFDHVRQLDTNFVRLQTDVYRNIHAVVNFVRGMEYYPSEDVILFTHNPQYCDPFGQSDGRGCVEAADVIQDAYNAWLVAVRVFGLPYMHGKYGDATRKEAIAEALEGLREGGWAVTHKDDSIEVINLASAAGTTMFGQLIDKRREDISLAVRGAAQTLFEGDGGSNAHGNTKEQRQDQDNQVHRDRVRVANKLNHQLFSWLVVPNWGEDAPIPMLSLGGVDWEETKKTVDALSSVKKELGYTPKKEYVQKVLSIPLEEDEDKGGEEKEKTALSSTLSQLQQQFYAGTLPQAACVANAMVALGYDEPTALKFFPTITPVNRVAAAEQQSQQQQPPASQPVQPAAQQPATFSASHEQSDSWRAMADELLKGLGG